MTTIVHYELRDDIAIIRVNNPPVNALSQPVRAGLLDALATSRSDGSRALVLICAGRTFFAGADISEFGKPPREPILSEVLAALDTYPKPVVAAIHGTAYGGGLETALCCHYRCAVATARVGLPEVKLGLLPGAGGTQRLPRLCDASAAIDIIGSGRPVPAVEAHQLNIIDRIIDGELLAGALDYARQLVELDAPLCRVCERPPQLSDLEQFESACNRLRKRSQGQLAPDNIIQCIEAALTLPFDEGLQRERELFLACMASPQSAALRYAFFAERAAARVDGLPESTRPREINRVGIVGAGTMGGGIAMSFANAGVPVTILDLDGESLQRGLDTVARNYAISVGKGRLSESEASRRQSLLQGSTRYQDLADADLVIEAVFEDPAIKCEVFRQLDSVCKAGAILASNTSYQDIDAIAAATERPAEVLGMHFFSPANVMRLLENVRGQASADDVIATAMSIGKRIGKIPVLARVCYGFIGNRMLKPYAQQAGLAILEGATPTQVDEAMRSFGMAMGPFAVADLAGLDVGYKARQALDENRRGDPRCYRIADLLVEQGRCGQKTGAGYYRYDTDTRVRHDDPRVNALIEAEAAAMNIHRVSLGKQEIVERLVCALVNEGARILAEGIAQRASDIDIVYLNGYGFPAWRGGPMFYADSVGLANIRTRIDSLRASQGEALWPSAPLLDELAASEGRFTDH